MAVQVVDRDAKTHLMDLQPVDTFVERGQPVSVIEDAFNPDDREHPANNYQISNFTVITDGLSTLFLSQLGEDTTGIVFGKVS